MFLVVGQWRGVPDKDSTFLNPEEGTRYLQGIQCDQESYPITSLQC